MTRTRPTRLPVRCGLLTAGVSPDGRQRAGDVFSAKRHFSEEERSSFVDVDFVNQRLPNPARPNNVLAPFWTVSLRCPMSKIAFQVFPPSTVFHTPPAAVTVVCAPSAF